MYLAQMSLKEKSVPVGLSKEMNLIFLNAPPKIY